MIMAQFVNWTSKSGRIKKIKVYDGWRFVKEQQDDDKRKELMDLFRTNSLKRSNRTKWIIG
jgi:hypothetical protein